MEAIVATGPPDVEETEITQEPDEGGSMLVP